MNRSIAVILQATAVIGLGSLTLQSQAGGQMVDDTTVASVAVNGGADSANPGTSCIRISSPLPAVCTAGYVAIPNNNKQLIATALMSKASGSRVRLYLHDEMGSNHCPGLVFTPCSVISIESK